MSGASCRRESCMVFINGRRMLIILSPRGLRGYRGGRSANPVLSLFAISSRDKTMSQQSCQIDWPAVTAAGAAARPPARLANNNDDRKRKGDPAGPGTAVITKTKPQTKRPSLYRVLLLNDDYTPMEFVVHVLERFFNKDHGAAHRIMMHVHQHGIGECGIYTYEVAETKVTQVMDFARKYQHPLQCVMEKK